LGVAGSGLLKGSLPSREVSMTSTTFHDAFLGPTDLAVARRVLDRVCAERGIEIESREADELAASVIRQVQHGTRDEDRLMTLFGTAKRQRRRAVAHGNGMPRHATR
jgi:formaldehyde-activating enzyme involved in methanogenesis